MDTFTFFSSPSGESSYDNFSTMASRYAVFPQDFVKINTKIPSETISPISIEVPMQASSVIEQTRKRSSYKKHPPIASLIDEAIYEKCPHGKGLSLIAVKKFIQQKYNINVKRSAKKIRDYIKESVESGRFIQSSGKGANGSFRLSTNVRNYLNKKKRDSPNRNVFVKMGNRKRKTGSTNSSKRKNEQKIHKITKRKFK